MTGASDEIRQRGRLGRDQTVIAGHRSGTTRLGKKAMTGATPNTREAGAASVDPHEIAKFTAMAEAWWDPEGKFRPLHRFNPIRLGFIRDRLCAQFGRDPKQGRPLRGLRLLDVGCGGGLLSEPMARLGAEVTGLDAAEKNIKVARLHAGESGLEIDYRHGSVEDLAAAGEVFDAVLNMEVVEHVADVGSFLNASAAVVRPGGVMIVGSKVSFSVVVFIAECH